MVDPAAADAFGGHIMKIMKEAAQQGISIDTLAVRSGSLCTA